MELVTKGSLASIDMVSYIVQILSMSWHALYPDNSLDISPISKLTQNNTIPPNVIIATADFQAQNQCMNYTSTNNNAELLSSN